MIIQKFWQKLYVNLYILYLTMILALLKIFKCFWKDSSLPCILKCDNQKLTSSNSGLCFKSQDYTHKKFKLVLISTIRYWLIFICLPNFLRSCNGFANEFKILPHNCQNLNMWIYNYNIQNKRCR